MVDDANKHIVFALAPAGDNGEPATLLIGIPPGGWQTLQTGATNNFDLGAVGLPVRVVTFAGKDHHDVIEKINAFFNLRNVPVLDEFGRNIGVPFPTNDEGDEE